MRGVLDRPGGAKEHLLRFARAEDRSARANISQLKYLSIDIVFLRSAAVSRLIIYRLQKE